MGKRNRSSSKIKHSTTVEGSTVRNGPSGGDKGSFFLPRFFNGVVWRGKGGGPVEFGSEGSTRVIETSPGPMGVIAFTAKSYPRGTHRKKNGREFRGSRSDPKKGTKTHSRGLSQELRIRMGGKT